MVDVIFDRDLWNRRHRYMPAAEAKKEIKRLNDWCEKHKVKFKNLQGRQVKAICPNDAIAYLFKVTWL